jgi:hypothetical protein
MYYIIVKTLYGSVRGGMMFDTLAKCKHWILSQPAHNADVYVIEFHNGPLVESIKTIIR